MATNLITNGEFETNITGWEQWVSGVPSQGTYGAHLGTKAINFVAGPGVPYAGVYTDWETPTAPAGPVAGRRYSAEAWFTTPVAGSYVFGVSDGPSLWAVYGSPIAVPANTPTRMALANFVPTNANRVVFRLDFDPSNFAGETIAFDTCSVYDITADTMLMMGMLGSHRV